MLRSIPLVFEPSISAKRLVSESLKCKALPPFPFTRSRSYFVSATRCYAPSIPESIAFAHTAPPSTIIGYSRIWTQIRSTESNLIQIVTCNCSPSRSQNFSHKFPTRSQHKYLALYKFLALRKSPSVFVHSTSDPLSSAFFKIASCSFIALSPILSITLFTDVVSHVVQHFLVAHSYLPSLLWRIMSREPCLCKCCCSLTSASRRSPPESSPLSTCLLLLLLFLFLFLLRQ